MKTLVVLLFGVVVGAFQPAMAFEAVRVVSAPEIYLVPSSIVGGNSAQTVVKRVDLPLGASRWLGIKWCHKLFTYGRGRVAMRITTGPDPENSAILGHHAFYTQGACPATEWFPEFVDVSGPIWVEFKFENYEGWPKPMVGTVWVYAH